MDVRATWSSTYGNDVGWSGTVRKCASASSIVAPRRPAAASTLRVVAGMNFSRVIRRRLTTRGLGVSRSVGCASGFLPARAMASPYAPAEYSQVAASRW